MRKKEIPNKVTKAAMEDARKFLLSDNPIDIKTNPTVTIQDNILRTAEGLIYGARNKTYKHPNENFYNISNLWNAYFDAIKRRDGVLSLPSEGDSEPSFRINKIDVAYLNILQKVARGATNQEHLDTIVDISGYAGCVERILKNK
jgi:hypothetical protein